VALRWTAASRPQPETTRAIAALWCRAPRADAALHRVAGGAGGAGGRGENVNNERDENGKSVRLRSPRVPRGSGDDLLAALRDLLGRMA